MKCVDFKGVGRWGMENAEELRKMEGGCGNFGVEMMGKASGKGKGEEGERIVQIDVVKRRKKKKVD
ncbi:hypothetical protein E5676_scaffold2754G00120 [Cucumis melo var. makuwa]|uniref:Uncharacterized protein n=2 Tax=Cucumis melo TaxID=3656 RepID=A0A5D3CU33_CUCMM|nr:hypothetical protein E6C27_scaffold115G00300 [Cucumis melo var. makuwa]TYK14962.1 hypothetical protein E5676_scaffold2754G00120 [Cucumis melo var. makuwa]